MKTSMSNDVAKPYGSPPAKRPSRTTKATSQGAEIVFTSRRPHTLSQALMPFFGGRVPA
jgi:hypothetical protein